MVAALGAPPAALRRWPREFGRHRPRAYRASVTPPAGRPAEGGAPPFYWTARRLPERRPVGGGTPAPDHDPVASQASRPGSLTPQARAPGAGSSAQARVAVRSWSAGRARGGRGRWPVGVARHGGRSQIAGLRWRAPSISGSFDGTVLGRTGRRGRPRRAPLGTGAGGRGALRMTDASPTRPQVSRGSGLGIRRPDHVEWSDHSPCRHQSTLGVERRGILGVLGRGPIGQRHRDQTGLARVRVPGLGLVQRRLWEWDVLGGLLGVGLFDRLGSHVAVGWIGAGNGCPRPPEVVGVEPRIDGAAHRRPRRPGPARAAPPRRIVGIVGRLFRWLERFGHYQPSSGGSSGSGSSGSTTGGGSASVRARVRRARRRVGARAPAAA